MASRIKNFLHSPLKLVLVAHFLVCAATGAVLIALELARSSSSGPWRASGASSILRPMYNHPDFFIWLLLIPPAVLLVAGLVIGLVFGRWGLPGHLQGRSVYWVPPLSIVYLLIGTVIMTVVGGDSISQAPHIMAGLFGDRPGLSLALIHAAMMTAGAGLGWAIALAVTHRKRNSGKWETIGYVEQP